MKKILIFSGIVAICFLSLWFRAPRINEGMPYFYREDEAHHFNRVVDMVKSGNLNPEYFHKPSLHFYMRIPVVAASFIWTVRQGNIRSVKEILTHDHYGLADYAFSASHPGIVKWNRAFSVLLSILSVFLAFLIASELSGSGVVGLTAALLSAISPALIEDSAVIGVDEVMTFMCLATIYSAIKLQKHFSLPLLTLTGVLAGLAVSSKYNALPIAILPLLACAFSLRFDFKSLAIALCAPALGFLAGTPCAITSLPVFLDQMAYEVWHYGVAAHEGHNAEPGWPQAMFYLSWLAREALGPVATAFGVIGLLVLFVRNIRLNLIFATFPILFSFLMIEQRTNFTRNMLVIVPCAAVTASMVLGTLVDFLELKTKWRYVVFASFIVFASFPPLTLSIRQREAISGVKDTRVEATEWLLNQKPVPYSETAIAGQLQIPQTFFNQPGYSRINQQEWSPVRVFQAGYSRLVAGPGYSIPEEQQLLFKIQKSFAGDKELERILINPQVDIYETTPGEDARKFVAEWINDKAQYKLQFKLMVGAPSLCAYGDGTALSSKEDYCWTSSRITHFKLDAINPATMKPDSNGIVRIAVLLQTPWPGQELTFFTKDGWSTKVPIERNPFGETEISIPYQSIVDSQGFFLETSKVLSPQGLGLSLDERRLGIAVKGLRILGTEESQ